MFFQIEESPNRVVWNFMELAYRTGLLDECLEIIGNAIGPDIDMLEQFAGLERLGEETDFQSIDGKFGELIPIIKQLTDEDVIEGLKILLRLMKPYIDQAMRDIHSIEELKEKGLNIIKALYSLRDVGLAVAPFAINKILEKKPSWKTRFILKRIRKRILGVKRTAKKGDGGTIQ